MKKINPKIKYDKESGVLSVRLNNRPSADSEIQGNVVLDYDRVGRLVRVSLYDFSFKDFKRVLKPARSFSYAARSMNIEVAA